MSEETSAKIRTYSRLVKKENGSIKEFPEEDSELNGQVEELNLDSEAIEKKSIEVGQENSKERKMAENILSEGSETRIHIKFIQK